MKQIDLHLIRPLNTSERWYSMATIWIPILASLYALISGMLFHMHLSTFMLLIFCYSCTVFGVTIGFHRLLTHRSFKANRWLKIILVCFGCMAYEGPPFFWIAAHRRHHKYTDTEFDPHSPISCEKKSLIGFYHAHMGWMPSHILESWRYYLADLLADKDLLLINKHYSIIAFSGIFIPGMINGLLFMTWYHFFEGIIVCGLFRVCLQQQVTWSINSICHMWGKKDFITNDNSRNNWLCALLSYGEGWHNNHHAFPSSAKHGLTKGQIDFSYWLIYLFSLFGLVQQIKSPTQEQMQQKYLSDGNNE